MADLAEGNSILRTAQASGFNGYTVLDGVTALFTEFQRM